MFKTVSGLLIASAVMFTALPASADMMSENRDAMMRKMMHDPAFMKEVVTYYMMHHPKKK